MTGRAAAALVLAGALGLGACSDDDGATAELAGATAASPAEARAVLQDVAGTGAGGTVRFGVAEDGDQVEVEVAVHGVPTGDVPVVLGEAASCPPAGGSFSGERLTSVSTGPNGTASETFRTGDLSLEKGEPGYVRGRVVVVGQPGAPLACGTVISIGRWSES